jgi:hypothetical protein
LGCEGTHELMIFEREEEAVKISVLALLRADFPGHGCDWVEVRKWFERT